MGDATWESWFRYCLTQEEGYVLTCYRYIEFNPVRAGMVHDPGDYPWSSYRYNGQGKSIPLHTPHENNRGLGRDEIARCGHNRSLFKAHIEAAVVNEIRHATNGNYVLGNDRFKKETEQMLKCRVKPGKPGRPHKTT